MTGIVDIQADGAAVAQRAAEWLLETALATQGRFAWCLSGGSTPKTTYGLLATAPFRDRFPWDRTHIFFGDERFVPHDHPDSNYRMAREAMIAHVPLPDAQVHPWQTDGDPDHAALHYADTLKRFYGADTLDPAKPLFDVNFLGLGEDGHTASLFPGVAALQERTAWTAAGHRGRPPKNLTRTITAHLSPHFTAALVIDADEPWQAAAELAYTAVLSALEATR